MVGRPSEANREQKGRRPTYGSIREERAACVKTGGVREDANIGQRLCSLCGTGALQRRITFTSCYENTSILGIKRVVLDELVVMVDRVVN